MQTPDQPSVTNAASEIAALTGAAGLTGGSSDVPTQIEVMTSDQALLELSRRVGTLSDPIKERQLITIAPLKTSNSVVTVNIRARSPKMAQEAVAQLVNIYNLHMEQQNSTGIGRLIGATRYQLASVSAKLVKAENLYASYSKQVGSIDPNEEATEKVTQLFTLRKELLDAQKDLTAQDVLFSDHQQEVSALDPSVVPSVILAQSPLIQADQTKLADLQEQRSQMAAQFTPQDDAMIQNQKEIDAVRSDMRDEMVRESSTVNSTLGSMDSSAKTKAMSSVAPGYVVDNLTRAVNPARETAKEKLADARAQMLADNVEIGVLRKAIGQADTVMTATPDQMRRLADLKNECDVYQKVFDDLQAQFFQLSSHRPADSGYAQVLQLPTLPKRPASPQPVLYTAAAAVFGLLLCFAVLYFLDSVDPRLRDPSDVVAITDLPVLQSVPFKGLGRRQPSHDLFNRQQYKKLAATLSYLGVGSKVKTLLVTSAYGSEGANIVAENLAKTLSHAGKRISLVDTTGPKPRVVSLGNDELIDRSPLTITPGQNGSGAPMVPTAVSTTGIGELFKTNEPETLIEQLKIGTDVVIFDGSAMFEGVDSAILVDRVDAVIYVTKLQSVTREEVSQALGLLLKGTTPILGVVLNDINL